MNELYTSLPCKAEFGEVVRYCAVACHPEHGHCVLMIDEIDRRWVMFDQLKTPVHAVRKAHELYRAGKPLEVPARPYA